MQWPQLVYLALMFLTLGIELSKHGETYTLKHNFWIYLIEIVLQIFILKIGGFFG